MSINKLTFLPLTVALLTASCTTPSLVGLNAQKATDGSVDAPATWTTPAIATDTSIEWLETFNDPLLLMLIAEGKAHNINLQVAAANIEKAWLLAEQADAALKPTVDLSFGGTRSGALEGTQPRNNASFGIQAGWEIDVWGRIRAGRNAAIDNAKAAEADYLYAQHSLSANIARTYMMVIEAKRQADITRKNLSILNEIMRITEIQYENGLTSSDNVALIRSDIASAQENLIAVEGSQRDATRALEVMLGRYPSAELEGPTTFPDLPPLPPVGIPSEVLERRPDIISAERRVAAAFEATAQAKAALLPSFSLTSNLGGSSNTLASVLSPTNVAWQLGANLLAPIFDGGRRQKQVEIATIEQKQTLSSYAQTALQAFSEVETNLDQGIVLAQRQQALHRTQQEINKAYEIAQIRYQEGESELIDVLTIQQRLIAADSNIISIERAQREQRINLYLSLGGHW